MCLRKAHNMLEISIIISIIGVLYSVTYGIYSGLKISRAHKDTHVRLQYIEDSLIAYFKRKKKLPCPQPITGESNLNLSNSCNDPSYSYCANNITKYKDVYIGVVPVIELGLDYKMIYDAWGSKIIYAVDSKFLCSAEVNNEQNINFKISNNFYISDASIKVKDNNLNIITDEAIYTLLSHGQNHYGAYNMDNIQHKKSNNILELENSDSDDVFIYIYSELTKGTQDKVYDDVLRFKTKQQLIVESQLTNQISTAIHVNSYFSSQECTCSSLSNNQDINFVSKNFCIN